MGSLSPQPPDVDAILNSLTLEEKISLLAGKNFWETADIPAKGIPALKVSDGPNGARGATFQGGKTAACFPASVLLASTWDLSLAGQVGNALAEETMTKGARALLAPTVCPHRHALGGRNFESFSEDPLLAGKMAANYIHGLQEKGVAATIKHFAANEQETSRLAVDETISERALREIYLKPFEIAIKEANPWAVMTSYNLINGTHADMSNYLLRDVLRGQWGWKGLVMSDWGGTNSTVESLAAGLDLEMPGPTRWRGVNTIMAAVRFGKLSQKVIDARVRNVLELLVKLRCFEDPHIPEEQAINRPEHQRLIRHVGGRGIVLLKNEDNILPLTKERVKGKKIALLGYARQALIHGGGSASLNSHYRITPEEGLKAALGSDVEFVYAQGAYTLRQLPTLTQNITALDGKTPGWTFEGYDSVDFTGSPTTSTIVEDSTYVPIFGMKYGSISCTTNFQPTLTGDHYMAITSLGRSTVFVDGETTFGQSEDCNDSMAFILGGSKETKVRVHFEAGKTYKIQIQTFAPSDGAGGLSMLEGFSGYRLGFLHDTEHDFDFLADAVSIAKEADFAIVFTGHTPSWETEGQDQASFNLPADGSQDRLVSAVSEANSNTIVVNSTGVPVAMPWLDSIKGLVQAWFGGQEAGNSIADILTGAVNPSGRLPVSFPRRIEDTPAYGNFPGTLIHGDLHVNYKEGVFVGYRHFDRSAATRDAVLFPFGYGLSYTSYTLGDAVQISQPDAETLSVEVSVTNVGSIAGIETVQVYAGHDVSSEEHPTKELVAFAKVHLDPGATKTVSVSFAVKQLAHFNEEIGAWKLDAGHYRVSVGQSVQHVGPSGVVAVDARTFAA